MDKDCCNMQNAISNRKTTLIGLMFGVGGAVIGAGLMYMLDPDRGRRRRELVRRKVVDTVAIAGDKFVETKEIIADQAQKLFEDAGSLLKTN